MPPQGPFAGGPLIRQAAQRFENREERALAEELRRLRREQAEQSLRTGEAKFRREFDFRPEGAETPITGPVSRPTQTDRQRDIEQALSGTRPAPGGAASDATESRGPGRSVADELSDLRSTGGAPLTPGDVREKEAVSRVGDMAASEASRLPRAGRLEQAMMPAEEAPGRIGLPEEVGGGSISLKSPQERRMEEVSQNLADAFGVEPGRAEAAMVAGDADFLFGPERQEMDRSEVMDRMADVTARLWLENPNADPREIARRANLPLQAVAEGRNRASELRPEVFDAEDEEDLDFLDTEMGARFRRFMQENPDASIEEFESQTGMTIPERHQSEAFDVMDQMSQRSREQTERRRAREQDFAQAFGLDEGPTNQWQSLVLRRAAARGSFDRVRQELQQMKSRSQRILDQTPTPMKDRRLNAERNVERADRLLRALQTLEGRAERTQTNMFQFGSDGTLRLNPEAIRGGG